MQASKAAPLPIDKWFAQQDKSVEKVYRGMRHAKGSLERLIKMKELRDSRDALMAECQARLIDAYLNGRLKTGGHSVEVRLTLRAGKPWRYLVVDGKAILPPGA